jgi:hypothetical protein
MVPSVLILIVLGAQFYLNRKVNRIMATQTEEAAKLNSFGDQLGKASDEIMKALEDLQKALDAAGQTSPEVDAATDRLAGAAQKLDDIVPDPQPVVPQEQLAPQSPDFPKEGTDTQTSVVVPGNQETSEQPPLPEPGQPVPAV